MKTEHTPGPWKYEKWDSLAGEKHDRFIISVDYKHPFLDKVYIAEIGSLIIEKEANSKLIAAAPELLEALENIIDYAKIQVDRMWDQDCEILPSEEWEKVKQSKTNIEYAIKSITKAKGL